MGDIYLQTANSDSLRYCFVKHEETKDASTDEVEADSRKSNASEDEALMHVPKETRSFGILLRDKEIMRWRRRAWIWVFISLYRAASPLIMQRDFVKL
jgi:hypothetical protein